MKKLERIKRQKRSSRGGKSGRHNMKRKIDSSLAYVEAMALTNRLAKMYAMSLTVGLGC